MQQINHIPSQLDHQKLNILKYPCVSPSKYIILRTTEPSSIFPLLDHTQLNHRNIWTNPISTLA